MTSGGIKEELSPGMEGFMEAINEYADEYNSPINTPPGTNATYNTQQQQQQQQQQTTTFVFNVFGGLVQPPYEQEEDKPATPGGGLETGGGGGSGGGGGGQMLVTPQVGVTNPFLTRTSSQLEIEHISKQLEHEVRAKHDYNTPHTPGNGGLWQPMMFPSYIPATPTAPARSSVIDVDDDDVEVEEDYDDDVDGMDMVMMSPPQLRIERDRLSPEHFNIPPANPCLIGSPNDEELMSLQTRELNERLKHLSKDAKIEIKARRRLLKNRGYARACRNRRITNQRFYSEENKRLRTVLQMVTRERDEYKQKYEGMKAFIERLKEERENRRRQHSSALFC